VPLNSLSRPRLSEGSIDLLGVKIDALRLGQLLDLVLSAATQRRALRVMYVNVHCMNVSARDAGYRQILNEADIVYCDGTGVRLGARIAGRPLPERMTGADWIHRLCALCVDHELSLFLFGSTDEIIDEASIRLKDEHFGLEIAGTASGYATRDSLVGEMNRSGADILLVGMGTPTQEKWISEHAAELEIPVVWAVGALFDFVSGRLPRGPRWMTDHGLEWVSRLLVEPRKLWRRYLIGNPLFLWRVLRTYGFGAGS